MWDIICSEQRSSVCSDWLTGSRAAARRRTMQPRSERFKCVVVPRRRDNAIDRSVSITRSPWCTVMTLHLRSAGRRFGSRLQPRCDPGRVFRTNVLSLSEDTTVWRYRNFIDLMDLNLINLINLKCIVHVIVINVIRQHHKYRD